MFDYKHYVPVLRWKQSEWLALRELTGVQRKEVTPLIEIVPVKFMDKKTKDIKEENCIKEEINKIVTGIKENWGVSRAFIDVHLLDVEIRTFVMKEIIVTGNNMNLYLIPVIHLNYSREYLDMISDLPNKNQGGACLRLNIEEVSGTSLIDKVNWLIDVVGIKHDNVDLIVDYKLINEGRLKFSYLIQTIPSIREWRTLTVIMGAFPKDLSDFKLGEHLHPRLDWQSWLKEVASNSHLDRLPTFGDYTIQHPIYSEPPERANVSASIRYASDSAWVIMRGEGLFHDNSPGFAQYPANALLLSSRDEFCGKNFSFGDKYIYEMGQQNIKYGNPMSWLKAGINHHITLVVRQLSSLSD